MIFIDTVERDPENKARILPFHCIEMDVPWPEYGGGGRGAQEHYSLIKSVDDIHRVIVTSPLWLPATDCHLWMWYTDNFLEDALKLCGMLGFRYVRTFVWVKVKGTPKALDFETGRAFDGDDDPEPRISLGQYGRGAHESMLFCVRGKGFAVRTPRRDIPSVFFAPTPTATPGGLRVHSKKPDAAYELIAARTIGPRLSMFSRMERDGWAVWGDQVG
jgi:N6-adenosine-specific RNA methylase IME4